MTERRYDLPLPYRFFREINIIAVVITTVAFLALLAFGGSREGCSSSSS